MNIGCILYHDKTDVTRLLIHWSWHQFKTKHWSWYHFYSTPWTLGAYFTMTTGYKVDCPIRLNFKCHYMSQDNFGHVEQWHQILKDEFKIFKAKRNFEGNIPNFVVITVSTDVLAPSGARASAGTVMTKSISCIHSGSTLKELKLKYISQHFCETILILWPRGTNKAANCGVL